MAISSMLLMCVQQVGLMLSTAINADEFIMCNLVLLMCALVMALYKIHHFRGFDRTSALGDNDLHDAGYWSEVLRREAPLTPVQLAWC